VSIEFASALKMMVLDVAFGTVYGLLWTPYH